MRSRDLPGGGRVDEITPDGLGDGDDRVYLDIHGGAFIYGGGELRATMATGTALRMAARVWAVDYRMPPDHPFPAALDDCLAAYRALLAERRPDRIVVGGASAGGNLAAALMLRARDEGLPLPAAVVLMTPAADLTKAGDSHQVNLGLDPLLTGSGKQTFLLYAAGADLRHPYLSPLNGEFSQGFPPPSSPPAPATCCCPTPCCCTGPCAGPAFRLSSTSPRRPGTAGSSAWRRKTRRPCKRSGASRRRTGAGSPARLGRRGQ